MITYAEAKAFIREHEKKVNDTYQKLEELKRKRQKRRIRKHRLNAHHPVDKVTFRLAERNDTLGRYSYLSVRNGVAESKIVVAQGSNRKPRIVHEYAISRKVVSVCLNTI